MCKESGEPGHDDLKEVYPKYYFQTKISKGGVLKRVVFSTIKKLLIFFIKVILRIQPGDSGELDKFEVEEIYKREARSYDMEHHRTTRWQDTVWRRQAGFFVANYLLGSKKTISIIDMCTGTGLTTQEICNVLDAWGFSRDKYEFYCVDYSREMLDEARKKNLHKDYNVHLMRGDATCLLEAESDFAKFEAKSIDLVVQMFGIGGVDKPIEALKEILKVLKIGGQYFLVDMHRPIGELPGDFVFFGKSFQMPYFEERAYREITVPIVLGHKWGWRETRSLFYLIRLLSFKEGDTYYGFKVLYFSPEPKRWWFSFPFMSVATTIVEKEEISKEEAEKRTKILNRQK